MKNQKLILAIVFLANGLAAMNFHDVDLLYKKNLLEKMFDRVGQSKVAEWLARLERKIAPSARVVPASDLFQVLGNEAQKELGIAQESRLPVSQGNFKNHVAETRVGAICVDEQKLINMPEFAQRHVFLHEAAHVKYRDNAAGVIVFGLAGVPTTAFFLAVCISYSMSPLFGVGAGALGTLNGLYFIKKYVDYAERRADAEALRATQCGVCINSIAQLAAKNRGVYLSSAEMRRLAEEFEEQRCLDHRLMWQR